MKRFFTLSLFFSLLIAFSSCEKIKDAATEDFQTTMTVKIPVSVEDADSISTTKSALLSYAFEESLTESLEDNDKINDYLDLLKKIEIDEVNFEFSGLLANQIIEKIDIAVEGAGVIATIENIDTSNLNYTPDINSSVLVQLANILYANKQLTVIVSGSTNAAPMDFSVNTYFNLHVEASPL